MIFKMETFLCQFPILLQAGAGIDIAAGADRGGAGDIIFNILMGVGLLATIVIAGYFAARFYRAKSAVPSRKQPQPVDTLARATRARVQEAMNRGEHEDRKSTRLNSSHVRISYAVYCLKKKKKKREKNCSHKKAHQK